MEEKIYPRIYPTPPTDVHNHDHDTDFRLNYIKDIKSEISKSLGKGNLYEKDIKT